MQVDIPSAEEFLKGCQAYEANERRDAMYKVASFLVEHFWGNPQEMADGLGVLLLTWNQAFYRYGFFSFDDLENAIRRNMPALEMYRRREILTLTSRDEPGVYQLFEEFLDALQIRRGSRQGSKSPVATAKALHLLAPRFFPLWDKEIARAYGCSYRSTNAAVKYWQFCRKMKVLADSLAPYVPASDRSLLKRIDEYNYAKFTQGWI